MGPREVLQHVWRLLVDWSYFRLFARFLLASEAVLGLIIITRVRFTEIDWRAYMQEVEGWAVRTQDPTNYIALKGNTGPLVYPAGFLYIYRGLRWIASLSEVGGGSISECVPVAAASAYDHPPEPCGGLDVRAAQWVFLVIYLLTLALALDIYARTRPGPPWICILLVLSKRLHSLFLLRLFNDCITTLLFLCAIALLLRRRFFWGTLVFSASISVKMNTLLALPALGLILLRNVGVVRTAGYLSVGIVLQLILAAPFLSTFPNQYFAKAFEFSRGFFHQWTVNWKFVPEPIFVSTTFSHTLLVLHLTTLLVLAHTQWLRHDGGLLAVLGRVCKHEWHALTKAHLTGAFHDEPKFIAYVLWACVFVGIAFSRTIHFQFYVWYFHSLPLLLWSFRFKSTWGTNLFRLAIFVGIEYGYTVVDSTLGPSGAPKGEPLPLSAFILQTSHFALLLGLSFVPRIS